MSAAPHVKAFCQDLVKTRNIWTIQFADGSYIKWENSDGSEVFPVWSTESRVRKVLSYEEAFEGAAPVCFSLDVFLSEWLPKLTNEGTGLGPNWAGKNLSGWTFKAQELIDRVQGTPGFHDDAT
jgi:Protein of unknown function (DUF2750)